MTREEALDLARAHLAEIGRSTIRKGSVADQARAALDLARFLLDSEDAAVTEAAEAGADEGLTALSAYHDVKCAVDPQDSVSTRAGRHPRIGGVVTVDLSVSGEAGRVLLTPAAARQFAAGLLNDADTAEGTEAPLLFPETGGGPGLAGSAA